MARRSSNLTFVPAYVSSPELTFGFMFALEDPERIAEVVKWLIANKAVSIFRLANVNDGSGPADRYVVNWSSIPQVSITTAAPTEEALAEGNTMVVNAFLGEGFEINFYAANS